jgi:hypothetical protein
VSPQKAKEYSGNNDAYLEGSAKKEESRYKPILVLHWKGARRRGAWLYKNPIYYHSGYSHWKSTKRLGLPTHPCIHLAFTLLFDTITIRLYTHFSLA